MTHDRHLLGEIEGRSSGGDWFWTRWWKRLSRVGRLRQLAALPSAERTASGCVIGRARLIGEPLTSRWAHQPCIAYWARSFDPAEGITWSRHAAVTDFALDCDDGTTITIDGRDAIFVVHVGELVVIRKDGSRDSSDELVIKPGDRVIAWGQLDLPVERAPFREALRLGRRDRTPIWVGLLEAPPPGHRRRGR